MVKKSKKSAFILSCSIVFSFVLTSAFLNLLLPYLMTGKPTVIIQKPQDLSTPAEILSLVFLLIIIIGGLITIGTYWLYKFFGENYFGTRSLLRWIFFGILFAIFTKSPDWIFSENLATIKNLVRLAGVFAAFFLSRIAFPLEK
jgi:hypothetical protein